MKVMRPKVKVWLIAGSMAAIVNLARHDVTNYADFLVGFAVGLVCVVISAVMLAEIMDAEHDE